MVRLAVLVHLLLVVGAPARGREVERDAASGVDARPRDAGRTIDGRTRHASAPDASPPRRNSKKPVLAGVLNVNRATEAELKLLPGIGRGRAHAIVERRNKRPFASLDELARMKGMKGVVRRLRSHLTVDGETTLRPAGA
jgi:competence protein ComEA